MTIHYHGTPITPMSAFYALAGRHFCVSFYRPDQVRQAHAVGQSVLIDNGAFSAYTAGRPVGNWSAYYDFCDVWLDHPTTWAVVPDIIDAGAAAQDELLKAWPHGRRGAPVWHTDEPIARLVDLTQEWPRVCIGSAGRFWQVLSPEWCGRIDAAFEALDKVHKRWPWIHMLRGMQLAANGRWPFASVDSTDVARNHKSRGGKPLAMASRWDSAQCGAVWTKPSAKQAQLF